MSQHLILFSAGVRSDKIPDAINWTDISTSGSGSTNTPTITGISESISLKVTFNDTQYTLTYTLNGGAPSFPLATGDLIAVNNNDTLQFTASFVFSPVFGDTVSILNNSDSDTLLDTFSVTLS